MKGLPTETQRNLLSKLNIIAENFETDKGVYPEGIIVPKRNKRLLIKKVENNPLKIISSFYLTDEETKIYNERIYNKMKFPVILVATKRKKRIVTYYNLAVHESYLSQS